MLSKEELKKSYIIVSNEEEYHLLTNKLIELGFDNESFSPIFKSMYKFAGWDRLSMIMIINDNNFSWANHNGDYYNNQIAYSDVIKINPLSLLESKLKELFDREDIAFYVSINEVEDVNKLNKLLILLDEKWLSQNTFEKKHINDILSSSHSHLSKIKKGNGDIGFSLTSSSSVTSKKIIYIKDILKEIGLEELNNKNNNNNN